MASSDVTSFYIFLEKNYFIFFPNGMFLFQLSLFDCLFDQNGSKESTPDVCPEYRRNSTSEDSSSSSTEPEPTFTGKDCEPAVNGTAQILSSTDTLVPEAEIQPMVEVSQLVKLVHSKSDDASTLMP